MPVILGVDPSLTACGFAVLEVRADSERPEIVGCIRTEPDARARHTYQADSDGARLDTIADALLAVVDAYRPVLLVSEAPAGSQHARSASALGMAYGVVRAVGRGRGLRVVTVQAHEAKHSVGGSRGASKDEVRAGLVALYGSPVERLVARCCATAPAREGAYDALAVAATAARGPVGELVRAMARGAA